MHKMVWLAGWLFWTLRPFETVFLSKSGRLPERGRKKREMIDERKKSVLQNLISCINLTGSDIYSYYYIFTCKSFFFNIITSKWRKLCRAALKAMTVACNDCNQ